MKTSIITRIANILVVLSFQIGYGVKSEHSWTYTMKTINTRSSNKDLIDINLSVERISRGVYALSGEFEINFDIVEGDNNQLEMYAFRSKNNDDVYESIPLQMSRRHWIQALNTHYKDVLMETFKDCSNLPYFEDTFVSPLEKSAYKLEKCQFSQEGLPNHLEPGTYKLVVNGYGDVEWGLEFFVEVEKNS